MFDKRFFLGAGILIGTVIGAGVFGIPYIFSKSGVLTCFFYLLVLAAVSLFINLFLGEIILRTGEKKRLIGYGEKYLGKTTKFFLTVSLLFGAIGSLVVYIMLAGEFLNIAIPSFPPFILSVFAWILFSLLIYLGIKSIAFTELLMNILLLGVFAAIFIISAPKVDASNFFLANKSHFFLPFGVFLFSLIGWNAVPEAETILKKKKDLKKLIVITLVVTAIFYFIFGLILFGVSGSGTTEQVFQGLKNFLGKEIIFLGAIFGLLAVATSFLVLSSYLKNTLIIDYKVPHIIAFLITSLVPFALYILGMRKFIETISIIGGFTGLIDGIIICLIYRKSRMSGDRIPEYSLKKPGFWIVFTISILILGFLSQIYYFFF